MYPTQIFLNISLLSCLSFPKNHNLTKDNRRESKFTALRDNLLLKRLEREVPSDNYQLRREAYEREVNDSITDYYAQRKAVMDRYHARQKEIAEKFRGKSITSRPYVLSTTDKTKYFYETSPRPQHDAPSNNADTTALGYYRLGDCKYSSEESLVYQHNIEIGLKGESDLDAAIEVLLDEPITITCIELKPFNNSIADVQRLSGGRGFNYVKLKFTPEPNRGLSYTIKIWGVNSK
ncbi:uncharacterized protein LOC107038181 [Diachasma alloeum]|uniref:uncharacterized protein LOC107038181 n=1 Tax=Diachasma alloeum TaxID=454923 RepID=UPI0007381883|nr:uncharacterized protein LOC107038181 [Diachasma alloeum]